MNSNDTTELQNAARELTPIQAITFLRCCILSGESLNADDNERLGRAMRRAGALGELVAAADAFVQIADRDTDSCNRLKEAIAKAKE